MTATLIIDSFHFNSATYQNYATELENSNKLLEANEELLKQNSQNQTKIIEKFEQLTKKVNQ